MNETVNCALMSGKNSTQSQKKLRSHGHRIDNSEENNETN